MMILPDPSREDLLIDGGFGPVSPAADPRTATAQPVMMAVGKLLAHRCAEYEDASNYDDPLGSLLHLIDALATLAPEVEP